MGKSLGEGDDRKRLAKLFAEVLRHIGKKKRKDGFYCRYPSHMAPRTIPVILCERTFVGEDALATARGGLGL